MSVDIRISHAVKKYGDNVIIPDLSVNINPGEFFTLLGRQGDVRDIAAAGVTDGGNFVDIYAESCHILYIIMVQK